MREPNPERRREFFSLAPKYYQKAKTRGPKMVIAPKKVLYLITKNKVLYLLHCITKKKVFYLLHFITKCININVLFVQGVFPG